MNKDLIANYINQLSTMKCDEFETALLMMDVMDISAKELIKMDKNMAGLLTDAVLAIRNKYESKYDENLKNDLADLR